MEEMEEKKKKNHKKGRPLKIDDNILSKIEYAYSIGCNDIEVALYADISSSTLYRYIEKNPDFRRRREELKRTPILKAREQIRKAIESGDTVTAKWLLEHRAHDEYNTRSEVALETNGILTIEDRQNALEGFLERFE